MSSEKERRKEVSYLKTTGRGEIVKIAQIQFAKVWDPGLCNKIAGAKRHAFLAFGVNRSFVECR